MNNKKKYAFLNSKIKTRSATSSRNDALEKHFKHQQRMESQKKIFSKCYKKGKNMMFEEVPRTDCDLDDIYFREMIYNNIY